MTREKILAKISWYDPYYCEDLQEALSAVVELHKPSPIPDWVPTEAEEICWCAHTYPCPTIQAIEQVLE